MVVREVVPGMSEGWWCLSRLPLGACFVVGLLVCFCKRSRGGNPSNVGGEDEEEVGGKAQGT